MRSATHNGHKVREQSFTSEEAFVGVYFFSVIDRNVFEITEKLSHFGQNFCKCRLKYTVTASFYTTLRQMTEMF